MAERESKERTAMTTKETPTLPVTTPSDSTEGMAVEELLAQAQDAAMVYPSDADADVQKETDDLPAMKASRVSGAGYKYIWDTRTLERFAVLVYMFGQKLKEKRQDGSLRFTSKKPPGVPVQGSLKCWLHAEAPMREHYTAIGLRVCRKSNLTNQYQVEQHCKKKHPQEYATIMSERAEAESQEGLAAQRAQTEAMLVVAQSVTGAAPPTEAPAETAAAPDETLFQCPKCELAPFTAQDALDSHLEKKHPAE